MSDYSENGTSGYAWNKPGEPWRASPEETKVFNPDDPMENIKYIQAAIKSARWSIERLEERLTYWEDKLGER